MMRLDHRYFYDLTPERIDALIAERRSAVAPPAAAPPPARKRGGKKKNA
jgi:hypothetical protein